MNYETKRDVFDEMKWELIRNLANTIDQNGGLRPVEDATKVGENYATRYTAALPKLGRLNGMVARRPLIS